MTTFPLAQNPSGDAVRRRLARLWRGREEDTAWVRPVFLLSLLVTGLLYLWNLSASGYANSFYSAAVQAGSRSWKAFLFGSLDAGNAITVDKPPAALWPMELSVRIFGLGSWQILVPEVLMAVATAAVLYAAVRRRFSASAGLITVAAFALTPVAALMFRFNNPDALLALLMTVAVYLVQRALEAGRTKWLVWAGAAVGFAFLVKTLQAFLILPPLALVYALCAPVRVRRRLGQLLLATLAMVAAGGWWTALVELWPAGSRPYIGGSQHNSFLELTFGYNGFGRINGNETGSVGGGGRAGGPGGGGGGGMWGETGLGRMFNSEVGSQISWLLPAALLLLVGGLLITWRVRRAVRTAEAAGGDAPGAVGAATDRAPRDTFLLWGGSLLMTAGTFSFMAGIFHQYYTVALAPYIAALVGMGATVLWAERARVWPAVFLAVTVAVTGWWSYELLGRTPDYLPWLRWSVLVGSLAGAVGLAVLGRAGGPVGGARDATSADGATSTVSSATGPGWSTGAGAQRAARGGWPAPDPDLARPGAAPVGATPLGAAAPEAGARHGQHRTGGGALTGRLGRRAVLTAVGVSLAASFAGPLAYTLSTVNTGHAGSIVTAGPSGASMMGGPGGRGGPGGGRGMGDGPGGQGGQFPAGMRQNGTGGQGTGGQAPGQNGQAPGQNGQNGQAPGGGNGQLPGGTGGQGPGQQGQGGQNQGQNQNQGQGQGGFPGAPGGGGGKGGAGGRGGGGGGGGMGGLLNGADVGSEAKALLEKNASSYTWVAAATGSQNAASYQLATEDPVMAIGGFNGSDPSPTLAQFKKYVADGRIHYFIAGGMGGGPGGGGQEGGGSGRSMGGSNVSSQISSWVQDTFKKVTVGDATFYDLTQKAAS